MLMVLSLFIKLKKTMILFLEIMFMMVKQTLIRSVTQIMSTASSFYLHYMKAIKEYPLQKEALLDPRVDIIIADGRKWLKHHPQNQYDLIIMNTTYHWRAYTSSLLSKNFLNLLKNHIRPKGIIAYNTTGSLEAFKTSTTLSPHAYLYENFVIISDFDWRQKL